jgi:hypothetical protein
VAILNGALLHRHNETIPPFVWTIFCAGDSGVHKIGINQLIILFRDGLIPSRYWRITAMASKPIDVGTCRTSQRRNWGTLAWGESPNDERNSAR